MVFSCYVLGFISVWVYKSQNSISVKKLLNGVCKIIIAIREDMVHEKKQINNESILKHLLVDYDISKEKGIL